MVQVNCDNDYNRHFNACMYEDYEDTDHHHHHHHVHRPYPTTTATTMVLTTPATTMERRPCTDKFYSLTPAMTTTTAPPALNSSTCNKNRRNLGEQPPTSTTGTLKKQHKAGKSSYKHVPHREKPPHLVERRNARERRRVQAVNSAFARLRKCVPLENRSKRLSKVKTLQKAIEYISHLQHILSDDDDETTDMRLGCLQMSATVNKENTEGPRWIALESTCHKHSSPYITLYDDYADFPN